jgi:hypothetical protein
MRTIMVVVFGLAAVPAAANDNAAPARGPIWNGRQHQPGLEQLAEREAVKGQAAMLTPGDASGDKLYRRVMKQSRRPLPTTIEP